MTAQAAIDTFHRLLEAELMRGRDESERDAIRKECKLGLHDDTHPRADELRAQSYRYIERRNGSPVHGRKVSVTEVS